MNEHREGFVESIIEIIRERDNILADAVKSMYDYINDRYAGPFPSKEQTDAVNRYMGYYNKSDGNPITIGETYLRKSSAHSIVMNSIRIMDADQLDKLEKVLYSIAEDPHYHMLERGLRLGH